MTEIQDQILTDFADNTAPCTLSMPNERLALLRRSRVLACDEESLWVSVDACDFKTLEKLIESQTAIHVTVRFGGKDTIFHSQPLGYRPNFITRDRDCIAALQLKRPERFSDTQRRKTFRVALNELDGVTLRLWRINEYVLIRDRVLPSQELPCRPKDLSEGGFGAMLFPANSEALNLKSNQRFRVELKFGRHEIVLEARLRYPEQTQRDDEHADCGFEFVTNDRDVDSRRNQQKLQMMLAEVQRLSVRPQPA